VGASVTAAVPLGEGGRRTKVVVINDPASRDDGRKYLITEMAAAPAEEWALRVLQGLLKSNVQIPEEIASAGWLGLVLVGFKAFGGMDWDLAKPLLDQMMACVQIIRDPAHPAETTFPLIENDIMEVTTRAKLRVEVWNLHQSFSLPGALLNLREEPGGTAPDSPDVQTSPPA
jgi:hypothetical protein